MQISLFLLKSKFGAILKAFTVRVHSEIGRFPWAKLWYLLRGLDFFGKGWADLPLAICTNLLKVNQATIYRWLKDGRRYGAFRTYQVRNGHLKIYLGSLFKVSWHLNIKNWGDVGVCYLWEIKTKLRALVTGISTQALQQRSRYAANHNLNPEYRKFFGAPHPSKLVGEGRKSSHKAAVGEVPPFVLHVSERKVFASKGFIHFGASQPTISREVGVCDRTIRRHQQRLGLIMRQICQCKVEYGRLKTAWDMDFSEYRADNGKETTHIGYKRCGDTVIFSDGIQPNPKKPVPNQYHISATSFRQRFFRMRDQWFLARCNIYAEWVDLTTMAAQRRKYRWLLASGKLAQDNVTVSQNFEPGGDRGRFKEL
jgi:hypothetical protein